jgi:hypothetical protein
MSVLIPYISIVGSLVKRCEQWKKTLLCFVFSSFASIATNLLCPVKVGFVPPAKTSIFVTSKYFLWSLLFYFELTESGALYVLWWPNRTW